jgi:hypothetical protein
MIKISEPLERTYWRTRCEPLLAGADIEVLRNVPPADKAGVIAGADATLFLFNGTSRSVW